MAADFDSASQLAQTVRHAESLGDYLSAFDQAARGVDRFPNDRNLKYLAVRAMARAGSPMRAAELYREYDLEGSEDVDIASLQARLAKDQFFLSPSDATPARLSAGLYEKIFERSGDPYPGINAATMWRLSGNREKSLTLARSVIDICQSQPGESEEARYWWNATIAEAALLLGDTQRAAEHLRDAAKHLGANYDAAATTLGQLRHICQTTGLDSSILSLLPIPGVIYYAGHLISGTASGGRFPASEEPRVAARIEEILTDLDVGFGYGSLACGADILFAEVLLKRGAELHVVLPFGIEEFKRISVVPGGDRWTKRFDDCLAEASSVVYATEGAYLGHDALFDYAAKIGMGLSRIRSRSLDTKLHMVAVWDGEPPGGPAGTAVDVAYWKRCGLDIEIIESGKKTSTGPTSQSQSARQDNDVPERLILPVLFGDIKGFSKLQEQHLPVFSAKVMAALAETIHGYDDKVLFTNTWGDAVHIVFGDVVTAARCALKMQEALNDIEITEWDLPNKIGMRISLHIGPVFVGYDHINRERTYFGRTLTRAARMEPVTPVGEVFVTEEFAALIAMERGDHVHCNYVGNVPLAKDFGSLRMYRLGRREP